MKTLNLWVGVLEGNENISGMIDQCKTESEAAEETMKTNLREVLSSARQLETAYRTVAQFYKNTESDKVSNVTILNATPEQVKDLDNTVFVDYVSAELKQHYDKLDLRENYSLLVLPGYLGSNKTVEKWSKIAFENKVMLVTDFANLEKPDDVVELFNAANLTGGESFKSNTIMTCNYLVGRGKAEEGW